MVYDQAWPVLNGLLDLVLELPPDERSEWIDDLPGDLQALRPRLRRLLADAESTEASSFLETIPKADRTTPIEEDDEDVESPSAIGPYRIVRKLGEGGMGAVWLAERADGIVKRQVALKLPRGGWPRAGLAERLARERDILATLNHPNIARLYDAGLTETGQPYLALEFVPGRSIDRYAAAEQLPVRARLELFLQVARAVAHAHARLIVHRDLKPSNVLVTDSGEVKLLDFGIAKLIEPGAGDTAITEASGLPLTPDYASPEQIAGEPLGVASDVYSLGVLLYELLAGVRPYSLRRDSRGALEAAILEGAPRRPSDAVSEPALRRTLRGDLDTIVLKALRRKPEERYDTVNALADDIDRYLHGYAVLARPDSRLYRLSRFVARNRLAVGAGAAVVTVTLSGTVLVAWQAHVASTEKVRAQEVGDLLTAVFRDATPYNGGSRSLSVADWLADVRKRVDRQFGDRPDMRVQLLNTMGASLLTLQDTAAAEQVLTQALQEATSRLEATHPETLRARVLLTGVYRFQGKTREMRAELDRVEPVLRARTDVLSEPLVMALRNRTHLEIEDGHYRAAEAAAQEAVDLSVATFGEHDPETVAAFLVRAWAYQFSRDEDVALAAADRAYQMTTALYPDRPKHPRVIEGRLLYGRALAEAGHLIDGGRQLAQAVTDAAEVFGASSRMVGFFSVPLAAYQRQTGEIPEAMETSQRALQIVSEHTRPESFRYAAVLQSRGAVLLGARQAGEALPALSSAVDTVRRLLPASNGVTRSFGADQALALAMLGRDDEAERVIAEFTPREPRERDRVTARLRYVHGVVNRLRGDYQEALRLQEESLAIAGGAASDLERLNVLTETGVNLLELGKPSEASTVLDEALALSQRMQTRINPDRADVLVGLGRVRLAMGRPAEALVLFREADRFWRNFDGDSRWAGESAFWVGSCEASLRHTASARSSLRDAARLLSVSPFRTDVRLAQLARRG